jgi:hypothetical protein
MTDIYGPQGGIQSKFVNAKGRASNLARPFMLLAFTPAV